MAEEIMNFTERKPLPLDENGMFHHNGGVIFIGFPDPTDEDQSSIDRRTNSIAKAYQVTEAGGWKGGNSGPDYEFSPTVAWVNESGEYTTIENPQSEDPHHYHESNVTGEQTHIPQNAYQSYVNQNKQKSKYQIFAEQFESFTKPTNSVQKLQRKFSLN